MKCKEINLSVVENYYSKLLGVLRDKYRKVAELEAVNSTPWWGGDYNAATHDPVTCKLTGLPTSESLKGVIRWILRATLGGYFNTYREIENILSIYLGGEVEEEGRVKHFDSKVILEVKSHVNTNYDLRLFKQILESIEKSSRARDITNALEYLGWHAYNINKDVLTQIAASLKLDRNAVSLLEQVYNRYRGRTDLVYLFKLFTIPRIKLTLMGKKNIDDIIIDDIIRVVPALPGSVRINVKLYVDYTVDKAEILARLSILALIYALEVHGIGRGTSRGFGRFRVERIYVDVSDESFKRYVQSLLNELHSAQGVKQAVKRLHEELCRLSTELIRDRVARSRSPENVRLPRLDQCDIEVIVDPKHPAPVPIQMFTKLRGLMKRPVSDVIEALSAIGYATLKAMWKITAGKDVRTVGAAFHTWILGLPRWQQRTGYCSRDAIRGGRVSFSECRGVCVPKRDIETDSKLRRKSPIIMYPVPAEDRGGKPVVVIVVYRTYSDHLDKISRDEILHVGRHGPPDKTPGRQIVSLRQVLTCDEISPGGNLPGCGPATPTGIIRPENIMGPRDLHGKSLHRILDYIYESAILFLKQLLL